MSPGSRGQSGSARKGRPTDPIISVTYVVRIFTPNLKISSSEASNLYLSGFKRRSIFKCFGKHSSFAITAQENNKFLREFALLDRSGMLASRRNVQLLRRRNRDRSPLLTWSLLKRTLPGYGRKDRQDPASAVDWAWISSASRKRTRIDW